MSKMDELERRGYKGYDDKGAQLVSDVPVRIPLGFKRIDNFANRVREIVRGERMRAEAEAAGNESFEEADDFNIADDPIDPQTPYEADFEVLTPRELKAKQKAEFAREDREDAYKAARRSRHANVERVHKRGKEQAVSGSSSGRDQADKEDPF